MAARRLRVALGAAVVTASALAGAVAASGSPSAPPLLVAVEGPMSGSQAENGRDMLRGVELAARQLNATGGLWDGRRIAVYRADDRADRANAAAVARAAISRGVRFEIGPFNSSVGLVNLPIYRRHGVLPIWLTSRDDTRGAGATVQAMNSQIAPIEERYATSIRAKRVTMLVDDSPNGAFTKALASRLRAALLRHGISVRWIPIAEHGGPTTARDYYTQKVAQALAATPDLIYVSTYYPEGVRIAKALAAAGPTPACLMGYANIDSGFLSGTSRVEAQRCVFTGIPTPDQMPSARRFVQEYQRTFHRTASVWSAFAYDSAKLLFAAIDGARSYEFESVERHVRSARGFRGVTGPITIDPKTGYRPTVPLTILRVNDAKKLVAAR